MSEAEKQPPETEADPDLIDLRAQIAAARKAITQAAAKFVQMERRSFGSGASPAGSVVDLGLDGAND